jgi:hypothetical protein
MELATADKRGNQKRIFSHQQEKQFATHILSICDAQAEIVTSSYVKKEAHKFYRTFHPSVTRTYAPVFSNGWISGFKARNNIPSRPTRIISRQKVLAVPDLEERLVLYSCQVLEAVQKYGAHRVVNMDETPTRIVQVPRWGWSRHSNGYADIQSTGNEKDCVTLVPATAADGTKLELSFIKKGTTYECIKRKLLPLPVRLHAYYTISGWMRHEVLLQWLDEVLRPYLKNDMGEMGREMNAALIMDDYDAHWTEEVQMKAEKMGVELIRVPSGYTSVAQPLDVSVMGPFKTIRSQEWVRRRNGNPDSVDDVRSSILAALEAWDKLPKKACLSGWKAIGLSVQGE